MKTTPLYRLDRLSVLDIDGQDAAQILHNLTTNEVKSLTLTSVGENTYTATGCESFITDVRGKTLGHVNVYRTAAGFRLIGAPGQSEAVAAHADKYTIREDSVPNICDGQFAAFVLDRTTAMSPQIGLEIDALPTDETAALHCLADTATGASIYEINWLGNDALLLLVPADSTPQWNQRFASASLQVADQDAFHWARTVAGFPWYGIDLTDKNLPQEADRDDAAVCFTKGCYLGQETVARLDALGQVQKKLVRWSIDSDDAAAGTELMAGEKLVGRLTSVSAVGTNPRFAIGVARRSHFDPGSTATGTTASGEDFTATVL